MQVGSSASNIQYISAKSTDATTTAAASTGEFSFWDVLDVINPLQHIPILSSIYREVTGDTMSAVANIAGGTLFGGPIGGGVAAASEVAKEVMGGDEDTQTALVDKASATQQASNAYTRMRVTTEDWLNPKFDFNNSQIA